MLNVEDRWRSTSCTDAALISLCSYICNSELFDQLIQFFLREGLLYSSYTRECQEFAMLYEWLLSFRSLQKSVKKCDHVME